MTLFGTSKSTNQFSNLSHQPLQHDVNSMIRISSEGSTSASAPSTYTPAPTHLNLTQSRYPLVSSPCSESNFDRSEQNYLLSHPPHHRNPPSASINRSRSLLGLTTTSLHYSPHQPHHPKRTFHSRLLSSMGSHESGYPNPIGSSTNSAPSTFRLLKSKIFSSAPPKPKATQSPKLSSNSSSQSRNVYLFPGPTLSSEHIDHLSQTYNPEQKVYLVRQRSKSNNMFHRQQESEVPHTRSNQLPSPPSSLAVRPRPSGDFLRSGSSFELTRSGQSIDLSRIAPSIDLQRGPPAQSNNHPPPPNNRIVVVDLNSNRLNFPSFNNKPVPQNGPRVVRLVGQVSNTSPENQSSQVGSSHRPTPIPHGGSGAILTLNPTNPNRLAAFPQTLRHVDIQHDPISVRPESLSLNIQLSPSPAPSIQEHNDVLSQYALETLQTNSSNKAPSLRSQHSSNQLRNPSDENSVTLDPPQRVADDLTPKLPASASTYTIKNLDTSISTLVTNTAVSSKAATSQVAVANKSVYPTFNLSSEATEARQQSIVIDFSEFANFLSYPEIATPKRHTELAHSESSTIRPPSLPSLSPIKPPSTPKSHLTPVTSTFSNQYTSSSLPSTPAPFKNSNSSPSSLRAFSSSQSAKAELRHFPSLATTASSPSTALSPFSPIPSPHSTANSINSSPLSSPLAWPRETVVSSLPSPPSKSSGQPTPSDQVLSPLPQSSSQSLKSQLELENARKIIIGLQSEVKQLKDASSESHSLPPSSSKSDQPLLKTSPSRTAASNPSDHIEKSKLASRDNHVAPSLSIVQEEFKQSSAQFVVSSASTSNGPNTQPKDNAEKSDSQMQSEDELELAALPSRLPIAKHRLKQMPSVEFGRILHSRTASGASTSSRTWKASLGSNGSTEYGGATSQSQSLSTYRTTPSPIPTSLKSKARQAFFENPVFPGRSRVQSPQGEEAWSGSAPNAMYPDLGENSSQVLRTSQRGSNKNSRGQVVRPFHPSRAHSIASHSSSSSGQLVRPYTGVTRSRQQNGQMPLIHDEDSHGRNSAITSLSGHSHHSSRRHLNRSGLHSVDEDLVLSESAEDLASSMITKVELLAMLEKQQTKFAVERQELLGALRQSREKAAQSTRECDRLRAEDGWKTEQLNKAREEIGWLSRLADTLELDKSKLEDRVHSMAKELRRRSTGYRKGSTPSSQSISPMRDVGPISPTRGPNLARSSGIANSNARSSDVVSLSRSTSRSSYSPRTPSTAIHRASYMSGDSVRTICPKGPSPQVHESQSHSKSPHSINNWRAREPPAEESDANSPGTRPYRAKHRFALAQRSESELRLPLTSSNLNSPRSEHAESYSGRQRGSRPRSIASRRNHSEYQHSEAASSEDERHVDTIVEEREDQVYQDDTRLDYPNRRRYQNSDYSEHRAPSDYQEEYTDDQEPLDYQDVVYDPDAHKGHSRNNSSESLAISPSSTVFADHQRNNRSRLSTYRHSQNMNVNPDSRNSLISLQLRPEDELFLENYLDDDEILSDDDF